MNKNIYEDWILFNGRIVDTKEEVVMVPLEERGLQFGDGVYEMIRIYKGKIHLLQLHMERFFRSMEAIGIVAPFTISELSEQVQQLVEKKNFQVDGNIYVQISRGVQPRNHVYSKDLQPTYFANIVPFPRPVSLMENGVKVSVEEDIRWKFCYIKTLNLLPNIMIKNKVEEEGYSEAILVRNGIVTEGCHSNFFIVKNGKLITHPANEYVLHGITRHHVISLARELGIKVEERTFELEEVYEAEECFFTATPLEILPVIQIKEELFRNGEIGPITKDLQRAYEKSISLLEVTK